MKVVALHALTEWRRMKNTRTTASFYPDGMPSFFATENIIEVKYDKTRLI